jgi:tetratricopeptide (TPR) repeat protein
MSHIESLIQACEADLRAGQPARVGRRLKGLAASKVEREWRLPLANICRRASLYSLGMTLLARIVHPARETRGREASAAERAEYAVLLLRSGALNEARLRLEKVDPALVPESLLYRAFCHFSLWEFHESVAHLERYLRAPLSDYARLVGRVNLAYALVESDQHAAALSLLTENIEQARREKHRRLESNSHSLRAQLHIRTGQFAAARADLDRAHALLASGATNDSLFINKWNLIAHGLEEKNLAPLNELRDQARRHRDWEALREADFFSLKVRFEPELFAHLLCGTPFASYRTRMVRELGVTAEAPSTYLLGPSGQPVLDLMEGTIDGRATLKAGRKCHQLLEVLLRDFYRPVNMGGLFSALFAGEHFDIFTSPDRVYQIIRRTRRWLKNEREPAHIVETNGFYHLELGPHLTVRVPYGRESVESMHLHFQKLQSAFAPDVGFSAKSACARLQLSRRTVQRLLTWGLEQGRVEKPKGKKPFTIYKIVSSSGANMRITSAA